MIGEPLKEPVHKDMAEKVETLTADTYGWIKTDSETAISAVGIAVALYFVFFGIRWGLGRLLGDSWPVTHWRGFTRRIVKRTRSPFIAVFSAFLVTRVVETPPLLQRAVAIAFTIAFAIQGALWLREILLALVDRRAADSEPGEFDSAINIIRVMVNVVVWALAAILILDNLGVNVTALVAGLGVGGIAIGLAAQGIFGDLFAALAILFDRPFKVGDAISFGGNVGTVEAIGLKTTRVRALSGEQLIISNAKLLDQQISNLRRITERRVAFTLAIIYQTSPDRLEAIPGEIEAIIRARPRCRFDRANFALFNASSLDFEVVYFVEDADLQVMIAERQAIGLAIIRRFAELDIHFAYPTQTTFTALPDGTMVDPRPAFEVPPPRPA
jgi:small-conductance mechanosensitive channel